MGGELKTVCDSDTITCDMDKQKWDMKPWGCDEPFGRGHQCVPPHGEINGIWTCEGPHCHNKHHMGYGKHPTPYGYPGKVYNHKHMYDTHGHNHYQHNEYRGEGVDEAARKRRDDEGADRGINMNPPHHLHHASNHGSNNNHHANMHHHSTQHGHGSNAGHHNHGHHLGHGAPGHVHHHAHEIKDKDGKKHSHFVHHSHPQHGPGFYKNLHEKTKYHLFCFKGYESNTCEYEYTCDPTKFPSWMPSNEDESNPSNDNQPPFCIKAELNKGKCDSNDNGGNKWKETWEHLKHIDFDGHVHHGQHMGEHEVLFHYFEHHYEDHDHHYGNEHAYDQHGYDSNGKCMLSNGCPPKYGSNNGHHYGSNNDNYNPYGSNGGYPGGGEKDCKKKTSTTCDFDKGFGDISGEVKITQYDCNGEWEVRLEGDLTFDVQDLSDSLAFHVHQNDVDFDDDTKTCSDAGGHFEVSEDEIHGPPWFALPDRHHGDLGNINTTDSKSKFTITDKIISLDIDKDGYIGKRVIVVHAAPDDFNPTRDPDSTGNAGARLGCCRIKAPPKIKNKNKDSNNDSNNNNDPYGSNGGSNNGYMGGSIMADIPVVEIMMTAKRRLVRPVTLIRDLATSVERLRLLNTTVTVSGKFVLKETCPSMWKI